MFVLFHYRSFFGKKDSKDKKPDKTLQTPPPSKKPKTGTKHNDDSPIAKKKKRKMIFDSDDEEVDVMKENEPIVAESQDIVDITNAPPLPVSAPADDIVKTPPKRATGPSLQ